MKFYTKTIEPKVAKAVSTVLKTEVYSLQKMKYGEINYVCAVTTKKGKFIVRVFGYKDKPEAGKLEWVEGQLAKHHVPHAKLAYYSRSNKFFPYGFMISEFVNGLGGWEAIEQEKQTLAQSYAASGGILRKVHNIQVKKFGQINYGRGEYTDFVAMEVKSVHNKLKALILKRAMDAKTASLAIESIKNHLQPYAKTFRPVLLHSDASRENSILAHDRKFILVDWDNAWAGIWMWDYIESSWWWLHLPEWKSEAKRKLAKQAFFRGYGKIEYGAKAFNDIEHSLHLIKSVEKMHYYYFDRKERKNFNLVKRVFISLLK